MIGVLCFPESPRWLLKHNKTEEARQIMAQLENVAPDSKQIENDINEIHKLNAEAAGGLSWSEFFSNGRSMNGWRASVACASQAFQQISESSPVFPTRHRCPLLTDMHCQAESTS